jgi:3'(2'), 5'-bisphosphate nucleotidase
MKLAEPQLKLLCDIAEAAARQVMAVYAGEFESWDKPDATPVTQADLRADAVVTQGLRGEFPQIPIWSEESTCALHGNPRTFFLVDPLDGTREFLKRNDEFTVNIALIEDGLPIAGVVLAPALGELFYAARGFGAWRRTAQGMTQLHTQPDPASVPLRVIGSRSHGGESLTGWLAKLPRGHTFVAVGSSLKFCRIAEGAADIYPRIGPTSQWDTAAGQAVLEEAGGAVLDPRRQALRYGLDRPVLNTDFVAVSDPAMEFPPLD